MDKKTSIECKNLSKHFRIYENPKNRLKQALAGTRKQYYQEFSAVNDVSFRVTEGETVGIVGSNGSGKSTLLQMICGTLTPSSGTAETTGRISALLELGSGFNPEFTGLENIYMNGAIIGLTTKEIDEDIDNILSFADIGDFINQPVRTYSSGMNVRLAFAIAINVRPDILIVDEALAVGDERFQRKCFSRIEDIREKGASILFVSHSAGAIVDLCDRALLMNAGYLLADGIPKNIITSYQRLLYAPENRKEAVIESIINDQDEAETDKREDCTKTNDEIQAEPPKDCEDFDPNFTPTSTRFYENIGVTMKDFQIQTIAGKQVNKLYKGEKYIYHYLAEFNRDFAGVIFGMMIKTINGLEIGGSASSTPNKKSKLLVKGGSMYYIDFEFCCTLNQGTYFLNAGVMGNLEGEMTYIGRVSDAAIFQVLPVEGNLSTGMIDFSVSSTVRQSNL